MAEQINTGDTSSVSSSTGSTQSSNPYEGWVRQADVNDLVGTARKQGYEKARKEYEGNNQIGGMPMAQKPSISDEHIESLAQKRIDEALAKQKRAFEQEQEQKQRAQLQEQSKVLLQSIDSKCKAASQNYDDFDATIGDVNWADVPEILMLADQVEEAGDVLYDLAKKPHKIAAILSLANRSPALAQRQIMDLANSIKSNREAKAPAINDPLKQPKHTNLGLNSGNIDPTKISIADLRRHNYTSKKPGR